VEILQLIEKAGHPGSISPTRLADRYDVLTYRWWVSRIDCWLRFSSRPHRGVHGARVFRASFVRARDGGGRWLTVTAGILRRRFGSTSTASATVGRRCTTSTAWRCSTTRCLSSATRSYASRHTPTPRNSGPASSARAMGSEHAGKTVTVAVLDVDVIDVVLDPEHRAEQLETTRRSPETGSGRDPCSERFERD